MTGWDRLYRKIPLLFGALIVIGAGCLWGMGRRGALPASARPARFVRQTIVIDAGHGGEDGGAVSLSGNVESQINLSIAKRLDLIFGLYGADVRLLRTEDISLHDPDAETIREKKSSDLRNRVAMIEALPGATLISIHQNSYSGSPRYHGAQVFYADGSSSADFAAYTQEVLRQTLDPGNARQASKAPNTVYLLEHVTCRAILVECGFLSNPEEDALLQTSSYQTKIAVSLAGAYLGYEEGSMS